VSAKKPPKRLLRCFTLRNDTGFMLYYLFTYLENTFHPPGFGVFKYITFRAGAATVTALFIAFVIGPKIIRFLKQKQIGEAAKLEAPETHRKKAGTPTMGGIIVLAATLLPVLLWADIKNGYILLMLFVSLAFSTVGFIDDYLKVILKKPKGMIERDKLVGQILVGSVVGSVIYFFPQFLDENFQVLKSSTIVPFVKNYYFDFSYFYIPMVIFVITATSNAVNLTDGLDGLAAGTVGIVAITLAIICYVSGNAIVAKYLNLPFLHESGELTIYCTALVGASLGFLWFNSHPAEVFMGDTGSLALGGAIGTMCILVKQEFLLPILGGIFFVETVSVIIQRYYFKYTRNKYGEGRRVFRMAPLHHHFEMQGWSEPKIVMRFYIIAILLMIVSLATLKLR